MLGFGILHKPEPALYNLRILTEGSLIVVLAIKLHFELWMTRNERTGLVKANMAQTTLSVQRFGHISYSFQPREKSSCNQLKYVLNNHPLLVII